MNIYNITQSFEENTAHGPYWTGDFPIIPPSKETITFLGQSLNSAFGVSASPMTHGPKAVKLMSQLGYDLITYRSVRSQAWKGQPYPHWRYVDCKDQLTVEALSQKLLGSEHPFKDQEVTTANSFGIQSSKPQEWQQDFEVAQSSLQKGQLLILSIMFTPEEGKDVLEDCKLVAAYAKETSAKVFEINLAHPNSGMNSLVFEDIELSTAICKHIKQIIPDRPIIAKVGYYKQPELLEHFIKETEGCIDGISSTNTFAMPIVDTSGIEMFPGRAKAGVSGSAIRQLSQKQAQKIVDIKKDMKLKDFVVIGIGGVTKPEHIQEYLDLGVDCVQSAVGVWVDPLLAIKYKSI